MEPDTAGWVPQGAWLAAGYAEWPAPVPLRPAVACLWASVTRGGDAASTLVLPDGCTDIIWELGTGACFAGPDTGPWHTAPPAAGTVIAGVRFRPGAGGPVLGVPLSDVRDQRVRLAELLPAADRWLAPDLAPAQAASRLLELTGRLVADQSADPAVARATALLGDPAARTEQVARTIAISERQLRRRCQAAAGYGPKTLQRVLRFQRFVRRADACGGKLDLAAAAADAGYADQPHLSRECAALSGLSPAALQRARRPEAATAPR